MKTLILLIVFFFPSLWAAPQRGEALPVVHIQKEAGGLINGDGWSSESIQGKVTVLIYVDPDCKNLNKAFSLLVDGKKYADDHYQSIAIINMAATWVPNIVIDNLLASNQKKFPLKIFVKDKKRLLVEKWHLEDNNSVVLIFDKAGKVLFSKAGKLTKIEIKEAIRLIEVNLK